MLPLLPATIGVDVSAEDFNGVLLRKIISNPPLLENFLEVFHR